jgi:hypothetical protein
MSRFSNQAGNSTVTRPSIIGTFCLCNPIVSEAVRPEAIDGHILRIEFVDSPAIVLVWRDVEINRVLVGIQAHPVAVTDPMNFGWRR